MQVEIDEVVSTIRVTDGATALNAGTLKRLVDAVMQAVDDRHARTRQRALATTVDDDGRGGIDRQATGGM